MKIKENDVFKFYYNNKYRKKISYPKHCFDGQLVAKENREGELVLVDTYYGFGFNQHNTIFALKEAKKKGELTFKCNLDEVEATSKGQLNYFDDKDIFDLSYQHKCCKAYFKRKDAKKSIKKMKKVIQRKIDDNNRKIKYAEHDIEMLKEELKKVKKGDIENVYI